MQHKRIRRGPSVAEISALAGVGTATVDRVLNARGQVSPDMQARVLDALARLQAPRPAQRRRIAFLCESGASFNRALAEAVTAVGWRRQDLELTIQTFSSMDLQLVQFGQEIERMAEGADGLVLTAREDPRVLRAARAVRRRGKPVVCLATDLPRTCRDGYVGSDEEAAGAAAAELLGKLIRKDRGSILFIHCDTYHAAKDRENGFHAVLAESYPALTVSHRLDVRNDADIAHDEVLRHLRTRGVPDGIYSVAGGNSGVGRALAEAGVAHEVVFVGHELNANSRALLKSGEMDFLIGRDQEREVMLSLAMMEAALEGRPHHDRDTPQVRIISRYTCA